MLGNSLPVQKKALIWRVLRTRSVHFKPLVNTAEEKSEKDTRERWNATETPCLIQHSSCVVLRSNCCHWVMAWFGLQTGQFSTQTLLLLSHAGVICAEWQHVLLQNLYLLFSINGAFTDMQVTHHPHDDFQKEFHILTHLTCLYVPFSCVVVLTCICKWMVKPCSLTVGISEPVQWFLTTEWRSPGSLILLMLEDEIPKGSLQFYFFYPIWYWLCMKH